MPAAAAAAVMSAAAAAAVQQFAAILPAAAKYQRQQYPSPTALPGHQQLHPNVRAKTMLDLWTAKDMEHGA